MSGDEHHARQRVYAVGPAVFYCAGHTSRRSGHPRRGNRLFWKEIPQTK